MAQPTPAQFDQLAADLAAGFGPISTRLAPSAIPVPPIAPADGWGARLAVRLSVFDEVIRELWLNRVIPQQVDASRATEVISDAVLAQTCTGVPAGARISSLRVQAPTLGVSTVDATHVQVIVPVELALDDPGRSSLRARILLDVPLAIEISAGSDRAGIDAAVAAEASAHVSVEAGSVVTLRSPAMNAVLDEHVSRAAARLALVVASKLVLPAKVHPSADRFPNTSIRIQRAAVVVKAQQGVPYAVLGANVEEARPSADISELLAFAPPAGNRNFHLAIDDRLLTHAAQRVCDTGDLGAFLSRIVQRHLPVDWELRIQASEAFVSIDGTEMQTWIACSAVDYCGFGKDLEFTASVRSEPTIEGGALTLTSGSADFHQNPLDAVICGLTLLPMHALGAMMFLVADGYLLLASPNVRNLGLPVHVMTNPIPHTDKIIDPTLEVLDLDPHVVGVQGTLRLVNDPNHLFAFVRVVTQGGVFGQPVGGVGVTLIERDNPAPADDDEHPPPDSSITRFDARTTTEITVSQTFSIAPDQVVASDRTGPDGRALIWGTVNMVLGTEEVATVWDGPGPVRRQSHTHAVTESHPDVDVIVVAPSGRTFTESVHNVRGRRIGSAASPLTIELPLNDVIAHHQ